MKFIPIHNFTPAKGISKPFILPHHNNSTLTEGQKWYSVDKATSAQEASKLFFDRKGVDGKGYPLGGDKKPFPEPKVENPEDMISREDIVKSTNKSIKEKLQKGLKKVKNALS